MSKLKAGGIRTGEKMIRTTITIDHDTAAALKWLRSRACREPIAASRLLRDAARTALRDEGMAIMLGKVVTLQQRADQLDAEFAQRLAE